MDLSTLCPPPEVLEALRRLRDAGARAFLVGGALRDALLGRDIRDWDVVTSAPLSIISGLFERVIPTGIRHGTLTVRVGQLAMEVSTFRGRDLVEDLGHRDFTIDAIAFDPVEGRTVDPFGGIRDLRARVVRGVEDPLVRFREDPLRAIRAPRIAAELGFRIHSGTGEAISLVAPSLKRVAAERVRDEMTRILLTPVPSHPLRCLRRTGVLREVISELMEGHRKLQGSAAHRHTVLEHALHTVDLLPPEPVLRWAGLLHDVAKPRSRRREGRETLFPLHEEMGARMAGEILRRLRFSQKDTQSICHLIRHHAFPDSSPCTDAEIRRLLIQVGPPWVEALLLLRRADRLAAAPDPPDLSGLEELAARIRLEMQAPAGRLRPVLSGRDVMAILGIPPGPGVGETLRALQEFVIQAPTSNTREALTLWLRETCAPRSP